MRWVEHEALIMGAAMFYTAVWVILLIVVHIVKNKEPKIDDFGANFGGIEFIQMVNNF